MCDKLSFIRWRQTPLISEIQHIITLHNTLSLSWLLKYSYADTKKKSKNMRKQHQDAWT